MIKRAGNIRLSSVLSGIVLLLWAAGATPAAEDFAAGGTVQPQGLRHAGIHDLKEMDPTLDGTGVKFGVICRVFTYIGDQPQGDYRPAIEHSCFADARFTFHDSAETPAAASPHSTAICSILFGEDQTAFHPKLGQFYYEGAAPRATVNIYEFEHFLFNNVSRHLQPDEDIIAAGMGSPFEDWGTRGIEALAEHYGTIVVAGIGNGDDASHPVLYPGAGGNVIGVGVVDSVNSDDPATNLAHFALAYPEHSSIGPTATGRSKPDIVAPGNCLAAELNVPDGYEATGDWSSFSTPVVAGAVGLLVQKAKQDPILSSVVSAKGGNCLIKAILLNSATKLPYWHKGRLQTDDDHTVPLDYIQGAGMLNTAGAYEHLLAGNMKPGEVPTTGWDLNVLSESENPGYIYRITLAEPADRIVTATIAWNRHFQREFPFEPLPEKDGNLRVELWAVDPGNRENDYLLDYSDSPVDNVEHIHAAADPNYTDYEIFVSFSDIDQQQPKANQLYAVAWTVNGKQETDNIFWYDLNADGIVNELDIIEALNNLANRDESQNGYLLGDINPDGAIDAKDLGELLNQTKNNRRADWRVQREDTSG
ncbi:MAG: S8 family serine peptidase [Planctomycetota bacterium]